MQDASARRIAGGAQRLDSHRKSRNSGFFHYEFTVPGTSIFGTPCHCKDVRWRTDGRLHLGYSLRERPILKKPFAYEDLYRVLSHQLFQITKGVL
jgi:hypothetical protein